MKHAAKSTKRRGRIEVRNHASIAEHFNELKARIFYIALSVGIVSTICYILEQHIINALLRPAHGQHFIYTSPMGGINFIFNVCIYVGIAFSLPVIFYHILRFLQPLMGKESTRFITISSIASGLIGLCGILFGYFIGLPATLHFLLNQFSTNGQIQALLTIQAYLSFVTAYLFGAALMFQLPLILLFINRIKPLKPQRLLHYERHVILFAFIAAFIMNPNPNVIDQLIVVIPIILMYQLGIGLVWFINRSSKQPSEKLINTAGSSSPAPAPPTTPSPEPQPFFAMAFRPNQFVEQRHYYRQPASRYSGSSFTQRKIVTTPRTYQRTMSQQNHQAFGYLDPSLGTENS